jgi:hypothetical protein
MVKEQGEQTTSKKLTTNKAKSAEENLVQK